MLLGNAKKKVQQLWTDPQSLATPLVLWFQDEFVPQKDEDEDDSEETHPLNWDPATMWLEISETTGVMPLPDVFDRFLAGVSIVVTDRFWQNLPSFIQIANVLGGSSFDPDEFDPADALECAWAITEAILLEGPDKEELKDLFAPEIIQYLAHVVRDEHLLHPPSVLKLSGVTPEESANTMYQFADDPELFQGVYQTSMAKSEEINTALKERLALLISQIESLPLVQGNPKDLARRLRSLLPT